MHKYDSEEARRAAMERGETTAQDSTLQDGQKHYAVMRYRLGPPEVAFNLTGTEQDTLDAAEELAARIDGQGGAGYGAERIA